VSQDKVKRGETAVVRPPIPGTAIYMMTAAKKLRYFLAVR
jgi:hypothetical protein